MADEPSTKASVTFFMSFSFMIRRVDVSRCCRHFSTKLMHEGWNSPHFDMTNGTKRCPRAAEAEPCLSIFAMAAASMSLTTVTSVTIWVGNRWTVMSGRRFDPSV